MQNNSDIEIWYIVIIIIIVIFISLLLMKQGLVGYRIVDFVK